MNCIKMLFAGFLALLPLYSKSLFCSKDNYINIFTPQHSIKSVISTSYSYSSKISENNNENFDPINDDNFNYNNALLVESSNFFTITKTDIDLMAEIVFAESRGEPFDGKVAVASVILNRLYSSDFPDSISAIVYEKNAFSCINQNSDALNYTDSEAYDAVYSALNGNDPTDGALYFYNPKTASSKWMKNTQKNSCIKIGNHVFFK